jgi:hypothetical protein
MPTRCWQWTAKIPDSLFWQWSQVLTQINGLYCVLACGSLRPPLGSAPRIAPIAWPVRQTGRRCVAFALPGSYTQSYSMREGVLGPLYVCLRTFSPDHNLRRRCLAKSCFLPVGSLAPILAATLSLVRSARCGRRFASFPSAMAFPAHPVSTRLPADPRHERTLCLANSLIVRPTGRKCKRPGTLVNSSLCLSPIGRASAPWASPPPPRKAIGPSPLPGRWPSAPNGQTLASRMDSLGGRLSKGNRLCRESVRRGATPLAGCVSIPKVRTSVAQGLAGRVPQSRT